MDTFCNSFPQNEELQHQCEKQQIIIEQLLEHITELEWAPNGVKYNECKEHFNSLIEKTK